MTSEPWTSTTFPSKVETFLASSEIMLSDSMLIGLSRSAFSASADSDVNAHIAARPRAAAARALFPGWHIKDALDLRLQHELRSEDRRVGKEDRDRRQRAQWRSWMQ